MPVIAQHSTMELSTCHWGGSGAFAAALDVVSLASANQLSTCITGRDAERAPPRVCRWCTDIICEVLVTWSAWLASERPASAFAAIHTDSVQN
jgi:hypothetical protein